MVFPSRNVKKYFRQGSLRAGGRNQEQVEGFDPLPGGFPFRCRSINQTILREPGQKPSTGMGFWPGSRRIVGLIDEKEFDLVFQGLVGFGIKGGKKNRFDFGVAPVEILEYVFEHLLRNEGVGGVAFGTTQNGKGD